MKSVLIIALTLVSVTETSKLEVDLIEQIQNMTSNSTLNPDDVIVCHSDVTCRHRLGSKAVCRHHGCLCRRGYAAINDTCQEVNFGKICSEFSEFNCTESNNEECDFGRKVCVCRHGFKPDFSTCFETEAYCSTDQQCLDAKGPKHRCFQNECVCETNFAEINGTCEKSNLEKACESTKDNENICNGQNHEECGSDDVGLNKKCHCEKNYFVGSQDSTCVKKKGCCSGNYQCDTYRNEVCEKGFLGCKTCQCRLSHELLNGSCVPRSDFCDLYHPCQDPNAFCTSTNWCKCDLGYLEVRGKCRKEARYCQYSWECYGENTECWLNYCQCRSGFDETGSDGNYLHCRKRSSFSPAFGIPLAIILFAFVGMIRCCLVRRSRHRAALSRGLFSAHAFNNVPNQEITRRGPRTREGPRTQQGPRVPAALGIPASAYTSQGLGAPPGDHGRDSPPPMYSTVAPSLAPAPNFLVSSPGGEISSARPATPPPAYDAIDHSATNPLFQVGKNQN